MALLEKPTDRRWARRLELDRTKTSRHRAVRPRPVLDRTKTSRRPRPVRTRNGTPPEERNAVTKKEYVFGRQKAVHFENYQLIAQATPTLGRTFEEWAAESIAYLNKHFKSYYHEQM